MRSAIGWAAGAALTFVNCGAYCARAEYGSAGWCVLIGSACMYLSIDAASSIHRARGTP